MIPTIRDVAKRAGVSISTVSRVLNNSASVHEDKKIRVRHAAEELGYRPNPVALSLLGQKTGGIGVLLPFVAGDIFSEFLHGIDRFTRDEGRFLMVSSTHRSDEEFKAVIQGYERRVDGLIVMSTQTPARDVIGELPTHLPAVFVNTDVDGAAVVAVNFDNRGGARRMTEHLLEKGHRRIAFVTGMASTYDAAEREIGFREALAAAGLSPALVLDGDFSMERGEALVLDLLASSPRPTAVFAANDDTAFGILTGLREAGLRVPQDMAVAGFDDSKLSQLAVPQLTTVRVPAQEVGRVAIERLAALIEGADGASLGLVTLPTEVVVRGSTDGPGPPRW
ncbi:MAG: LacI family DNA-binding transcriptional regulator [Bacteroidota bacterium]